MAANETVTNMADVTNQLIADAANAEAQRDAVLARIAELEVAQAALSAVTTATVLTLPHNVCAPACATS
eukprot:COSAG01_NODE_13671_length_1550_cov_10.459683_3_plen_69_part_00